MRDRIEELLLPREHSMMPEVVYATQNRGQSKAYEDKSADPRVERWQSTLSSGTSWIELLTKDSQTHETATENDFKQTPPPYRSNFQRSPCWRVPPRIKASPQSERRHLLSRSYWYRTCRQGPSSRMPRRQQRSRCHRDQAGSGCCQNQRKRRRQPQRTEGSPN